jgi:hypothetical protein
LHPEDRIWKSKAGLIEEGRIFLIYSFPVFSAIAQHNKLKNVAINRPPEKKGLFQTSIQVKLQTVL